MKKFIVPVLSICFFISCSTDDTAINTVETTTTDSAFNKKITTKTLSLAANNANAYDFAGKLYMEILDDYLTNYPLQASVPTTIANVEPTAYANADFEMIAASYTGLTAANMQWTMANINSPNAIMTKAGLSERGKIVMGNLIALIPACEFQPFSASYNSIIAFEAGVMANVNLTDTDERVILTSCSIARFAISYAKDRPRKWERTKNSIVASSGANEIPLAITTSVSADALTY